jgi:hypothetical protein
MVGKANIGAVQVPPAPSAIVLNEALKLLATFGDSKSLAPVLKKMQEAQAANAELIAQIQAGKAELEKAQAEFDAERSAKESQIHETLAKLKEQADRLISTEAVLNMRAEKIKKDGDEMANHHQFMTNKFNVTSERLNEKESELKAREYELIKRTKDVTDAEVSIAERLHKLEERENSLRAFLSV